MSELRCDPGGILSWPIPRQQFGAGGLSTPGALLPLPLRGETGWLLITSGLAMVSVSLDRTPRTAVGLLAPGALIEQPPAGDGEVISYHAVVPTTTVEASAHLLRPNPHEACSVYSAYIAQLRERVLQAELVAACNAQHSLAERCARWLLRLYEQLGEVVPVTHAFLAMLLGVRRAGVSVVLEALQHEGMVTLQRGRIMVADAARLHSRACPCPNECFRTKYPISLETIRGHSPLGETARAWIEREMQVPLGTGEGGSARRAAALRVCHQILLQGRSLLVN
jgi:CRP-like cAMP-binding protein